MIASTGFLSYAPIKDAVMKNFNYAKHMPTSNSEEYRRCELETKAKIVEEVIGIFLTIVGTIIWAYGDKI